MKIYTSVRKKGAQSLSDAYGRTSVFFIVCNNKLLYLDQRYYYKSIDSIYNAYIRTYGLTKPHERNTNYITLESAKDINWEDTFLFNFDDINELKEKFPEEFI